MRISSVGEMAASPDVAVIINVHTDLVATLALASAVRHAPMPVLFVNCDPTAASSAHFDQLASQWGFTILDAPVRPHHAALTRLFEEIRSEVVLLLDSDAEIRDASLVPALRASFAHPRVFGAGFVHGPMWLDGRSHAAPKTSMYQERAWLPCVMFRTAHVREALGAGVTFAPRTIFNDFMWSEKISKGLGARFQTDRAPKLELVRRLPEPVRTRLQRARLPALAWARRDFYGSRPNYVVCDTGADLYQWCKYQGDLVFAGNPVALRSTEQVNHLGGLTRTRLGRYDGFARRAADVEQEVIARLADEYGVEWTGCGPGAGS
jgi:hypothetical protein